MQLCSCAVGNLGRRGSDLSELRDLSDVSDAGIVEATSARGLVGLNNG